MGPVRMAFSKAWLLLQSKTLPEQEAGARLGDTQLRIVPLSPAPARHHHQQCAGQTLSTPRQKQMLPLDGAVPHVVMNFFPLSGLIDEPGKSNVALA